MDKNSMFRLYEVSLAINIDDISDIKKIHSLVYKSRHIIKESFFASEYDKKFIKKDMNVFISVIKFFLIQKFTNQNVEIVKVIDKSNDVVYLLFEDVFKEKYYFVVYLDEQEINVLSDNTILEILSGRGIPENEQSFDLIYVKKQTIDKRRLMWITFDVIMIILLIILLTIAIPRVKNVFFIKKTESPPPRIYFREEIKSVKVELWQKLSSMWKSIIQDTASKDGVIIKKINVNITEVDKQTSRASFNLEVIKAYSYPEINTRKENDVYISTENINENLEFNEHIKKTIQVLNVDNCIKTLLHFFDVEERKANEVTFAPREFDLTYETAKNFIDFLVYLQEVCGYNLVISNFGIDVDKNVIYIGNVIKFQID